MHNMNPGTVAVLVITDGRHDYLRQCVDSLLERVRGNITEWWMYDDTGDPTYRHQLARQFPDRDLGNRFMEDIDLAVIDHRYKHRQAKEENVPLALPAVGLDLLRATAAAERKRAGLDSDPQTVDKAVAHWLGVRRVRVRWVNDGGPVDLGVPQAHPVVWRHINAGPRQGFSGAIQYAWRHLLGASNAEWIFHVEQDFVFREEIDLDAMAAVMTANPHLAQMALCRQAVNDVEHSAGGVVEVNRGAYLQCSDPAGADWLEHQLFWTTNPSLYRLSMCAVPWPSGPQSEGRFTHHLLRAGAPGIAPDRLRFGYWGRYGEHVLVEHIGKERAGHGY